MLTLILRLFVSLPISLCTIPTPEVHIKWGDYSSFFGKSSFPIEYSIRIGCQLLNKAACDQDGKLTLYSYTGSSTTPVSTDLCKVPSKTHLIHLNDSTIVQRKFKCHYSKGNEAQESAPASIPWVFCPHDSKDCINSACSSENELKVCMWTQNGPMPCSKIPDESWCLLENKDYRYCPVDQVGYCSSVVKNPSAIWFRTMGKYTCPAVTSPPVSYKGKSLSFGDTIEYDPAFPTIRFECPPASPFFNSKIHTYGSAVASTSVVCSHEINIPFGGFYLDGGKTGLHEIFIDAISNNTAFATFVYRTVVLGDVSLQIEASPLKNAVICKVDFEIASYFREVRWVTKKGSEFRIQGVRTTSDNPTRWVVNPKDGYWRGGDLHFSITESGEYQCHMELIYQTCAPHTKLVKEIQSGFLSATFTMIDAETTSNRALRNQGFSIIVHAFAAMQVMAAGQF